ncbi:MAG: diaminopimelate decarboxylase [Candidatus Sumerlaeota bacterium]|nr:diaminopimelate decarboxylase [Candidatus Sumerlaeota bacterium]
MELRKHPVFTYKGNALTCGGISLADIAAEHGTPVFVYSADALRKNYQRIRKAFAAAKPLIAYSVKANSNAAILRVLAAEGAGFDVVSANEMDRVLACGVAAERIIFAGVGKTTDEMARALRAGVKEFNVESPAEADRLDEVARRLKRVAPVAIRVNPNVDAKTHKFIATGKKENKFGMSLDAARDLACRIGELPGLRLDGIHAHIGSQILQAGPHAEAADILDTFLATLKADGHQLRTLNFGGGFGIAYSGEQQPLDLKPIAATVIGLAKKHGLSLLLEPGRSVIGPTGALLTSVQYIKRGSARTFVIVDAAMTELIRPALYEAHHDILPLVKSKKGEVVTADVVGPVCESGDFLAQEREMMLPAQDDLLAVVDAGAYCSAMSSNYNSRTRPAEVLVDDGKAYLIRRRETKADLTRHEVVPEYLK